MEIGRDWDTTWKNKWPQESDAPKFKQTMLQFFQVCFSSSPSYLWTKFFLWICEHCRPVTSFTQWSCGRLPSVLTWMKCSLRIKSTTSAITCDFCLILPSEVHYFARKVRLERGPIPVGIALKSAGFLFAEFIYIYRLRHPHAALPGSRMCYCNV
jgi:hypothetical protein